MGSASKDTAAPSGRLQFPQVEALRMIRHLIASTVVLALLLMSPVSGQGLFSHQAISKVSINVRDADVTMGQVSIGVFPREWK